MVDRQYINIIAGYAGSVPLTVVHTGHKKCIDRCTTNKVVRE